MFDFNSSLYFCILPTKQKPRNPPTKIIDETERELDSWVEASEEEPNFTSPIRLDYDFGREKTKNIHVKSTTTTKSKHNTTDHTTQTIMRGKKYSISLSLLICCK